MQRFKIQEKGELKILNLDLVTYVVVREDSIGFYFVTEKPLTFTKTQLGPDEFKKIRDPWTRVASIEAL